MTWRWPVALLAAAVVSGCGGGGQSAASAPPSSKPLPVRPLGALHTFGADYTENGVAKSVDIDVRASRLRVGAKPTRPYGVKADRGKVYALLHVRMRNRGRDTFDDDVSNFMLIDRSGQTYEAHGTTGSFSAATLGNDTFSIPPGARRSGVIAAQVPRGTKITEVDYVPLGDSGLSVRWSAR